MTNELRYGDRVKIADGIDVADEASREEIGTVISDQDDGKVEVGWLDSGTRTFEPVTNLRRLER